MFSQHVFTFSFNPSSGYPRYYLCSFVMFVEIRSFMLLLKDSHCNFCNILGTLYNFIQVVDQLCLYLDAILSQQFEQIPRHIFISCDLLIQHLLDSFLHLTEQNIRTFLVCIIFLSVLTSMFYGR